MGLLLIFLGAFTQGFYDLGLKLLVNKMKSEVVAAITLTLAGLTLLILDAILGLTSINDWFSWQGGLLWPLLVTVVLNIFIQFGYAHALKIADLSLIAPIAAFQPIFVILTSFLFLGEVPSVGGVLGILVIVSGVYFLGVREVAPSTIFTPLAKLFSNPGTRLSFVIALIGAICMPFDKRATLLSSPIFCAGIKFFICGILGGLIRIRPLSAEVIRASELKLLILVALLLAAIEVLYCSAYYYELTAYVGALKRLYIVADLIVAWVVLKEVDAARRWPAALLMVAGAGVIAVWR